MADNLMGKLATAGAAQLITVSRAITGFNAELSEQPAVAITTINAMLGTARKATKKIA